MKREQTDDKFPKDCFRKQCKYFSVLDMNIYDLDYYCDLLKIRCDVCNEEPIYLSCPLSEDSSKSKGEQ